MKLDRFKIDTNKDKPLNIKKNNVKTKKTRRSAFSNRKKPNFNYKNITKFKLAKKLRKALKRFDKHHLEYAIKTITIDKVPTKSITRSLHELDQLCIDCVFCIRTVGYCAYYKHNTKITQLRDCEVRSLIK